MNNKMLKKSECQNCGRPESIIFQMKTEFFRKNKIGKTDGEVDVCYKCKEYFYNRKLFTDNIVKSGHNKKLIVAGPGTGKTYIFRKVLKKLLPEKKAIVFTLINNLVNDLKEDLSSLENENIKVTTFHGFCKELLHSKISLTDLNRDFEYFPKLPELIKSDSEILEYNYTIKDFRKSFSNINENAVLQFYLDRSSYYNAVSHNDSVFRVYKYFMGNKEDVPEFEIVISDEYQDFNLLESKFIDLLAEKNNILITGDDDQALYAFRDASKELIRDVNSNPLFKKFDLPFCSRCTPVLVKAVNYFIEKAQQIGLLKRRIPRDYKCYFPDKINEHQLYPYINVAYCSRFPTSLELIKSHIETVKQSENLPNNQIEKPHFLIIGPESGYRLKNLHQFLIENLDNNIYYIETTLEKEVLKIEDGYNILHAGNNKNLGWRIILHFDPLDNMDEIILNIHQSNSLLEDLLPDEYKILHQKRMNEIYKNEDESDSELEEELNEENNECAEQSLLFPVGDSLKGK